MACSVAQRIANQRNARKSTGPRTPEGKAASRENGLKHGLTGECVVVPKEDADEVDRRFATLQAEMKPRNEVARKLVLRIALLTVRLERSAEQEARAIDLRMRRAEAEFVDARLAEAEHLMNQIAIEPATYARRLRSTPEGIDLLAAKIGELLADLRHPEGMGWDFQHDAQYHYMIGRHSCDVPLTRVAALSQASRGRFEHLKAGDGDGLQGKDLERWALEELAPLLDEEVAKLKALKAGLDLEGLAKDRAEAAARAMFDPSKEAILARKYEAATERGLYRALREFREVQAEAEQAEAEEAIAPEPVEEMGSGFPATSGNDDEAANIDPTPRFGADRTPSEAQIRGQDPEWPSFSTPERRPTRIF